MQRQCGIAGARLRGAHQRHVFAKGRRLSWSASSRSSMPASAEQKGAVGAFGLRERQQRPGKPGRDGGLSHAHARPALPGIMELVRRVMVIPRDRVTLESNTTERGGKPKPRAPAIEEPMLNRIFPRAADNAYRGHWLGMVLFVTVVLIKGSQGALSMASPADTMVNADGIPSRLSARALKPRCACSRCSACTSRSCRWSAS